MRGLWFAFAALFTLTAYADEWVLPEIARYESPDGLWRVVVTPKRLESQLAYFEDKVGNVPNAGALPRDTRNHAKAALYRRRTRDGSWRRAARWRLVNEVSPVSALVANDGSLATFDNWHSMGYGDDVIAIYRRDGSLVRKFALSDLMSEDDILWLSRSVSSIWWSGKHRIDNIAHALVIGVDGPTSTEIPISLSSGALLVPKRPLFKQFTVNWGAEEPGSSRCRNGEWTFSAEELAKLAIGACNPDYPRVARNARITGTVLLEFATDAAGKITDITILKPLAFGLDHAARDAFATWRFHPLVRNGTPVSGCGRVKFVFGSWPR